MFPLFTPMFPLSGPMFALYSSVFPLSTSQPPSPHLVCSSIRWGWGFYTLYSVYLQCHAIVSSYILLGYVRGITRLRGCNYLLWHGTVSTHYTVYRNPTPT